MKVPPGKVRNRPTDLGREAGKHLARFCDQAEAKKTTLHPRCTTCAFRAGSMPNGCESTVMDALKCSMEDTPFMCHERKGQPCSGWVMMRSNKPFKVSWPWSYGDEEPNAAPSEQGGKDG